jgi:hypothetical protein
MATGKKPPGSNDEDNVDVEGLFGELFDDAPPTQPNATTLGDEEVTLEVPAPGGAAKADAGGPPEVEAPALFAPVLPEMDAEIWQAGIQALVTVPDRVEPAETSGEAWLEEARLFQTESASAEMPEQAAALLTAAARATELGGEPAQAASGYDDALTQAPSAADALRARARLAESTGDVDEAHALWARLAIAAGTAEERAFYGALSAEWTLARRGALPAVTLDAIPAGAARALAVAEEALRGGTPGAAGGAFAAAGRALGGGLGAAFLDQAARFAVAARDGASATAYRLAARKLDPEAAAPLGRLRAAAEADRRSVAAKIGELAETLPHGSTLAQAVGRWAVGLARQRGDAAGALDLISSLDATTVAAARDRIDLEIATNAPLDAASLGTLRERATAPAAAATLTWVEAGGLVRQGAWGEAVPLLARAIEAQGDAVPLALLAEEIAGEADDPALEAEALDVWLRGDPARRAEAAFRLAAVREAVGSGLGARAALQTAMESAPESLAFWTAAAADARSGRRSDAAAALDYGAELWGASALAPALRAMAAVKHSASDPARVLAALGMSGASELSAAARALGAEAVARLAERAGDRPALEAALALATEQTTDAGQRTWIALRRASAIPVAEGEAHAAALEGAREASPGHPLAVALALAEPGVEPAHAAATLARLATIPSDLQSLRRTAAFAAASTLALATDRPGALRQAVKILTSSPNDREAHAAVARAAAKVGGPAGAEALAALSVDAGERDEPRALAIAEARRGGPARLRRRGAAGARRRPVRGRRAAGSDAPRRGERGFASWVFGRSLRRGGCRRPRRDPGGDRRGGRRALGRAGGGARDPPTARGLPDAGHAGLRGARRRRAWARRGGRAPRRRGRDGGRSRRDLRDLGGGGAAPGPGARRRFGRRARDPAPRAHADRRAARPRRVGPAGGRGRADGARAPRVGRRRRGGGAAGAAGAARD